MVEWGYRALGGDRPAATLAWILALTWTHTHGRCPGETLGCVENVTTAALKISCLRPFYDMASWTNDAYMCARQSRHITTSAIVVCFYASDRVHEPRPSTGDWECIIPDIRIDPTN
jgi:hypothetical protein